MEEHDIIEQGETGEFLTLDAIRDANDTQYDTVPVPEWGGGIQIKSLTKGEHQQARHASLKRGEIDPDMLELNLLVRGVVAPKLTAEDAGMLQRKNAGVIERVLREILTLSGLTQEQIDAVDKRFRD